MIQNGERANAEHFNAAFVSKTEDDTKIGKLNLNDSSSAAITDVQATINANTAAIAAKPSTTYVNAQDATTLASANTYTDGKITALIGSAGPALDTLGEIQAQVLADESTAAALATVVGSKAPNVLTGFTSGAGTVGASDTVLQALQKLNGNDALKAPIASPTFTGTVTAPTFVGALTGNATSATTATSATNFSGSLSGEVTGTQGATAIAAATVTGKALTGFTSGAGTVAATDTILQAIQKLNGNDALKAPIASPTFTGKVKLSSTTNGIVPPSMTTTQRNAIASPEQGELVFNTTTASLQQYKGTAWEDVGSGAGGGIPSLIPKGTAETDATGWFSYNDQVLAPNQAGSVFVATDVIAYNYFSYGDLLNDTPVTLSSTITMPGGLTAGVTYYVRDYSSGAFKLAATLGGAAINITSTGSGDLTIYPVVPRILATSLLTPTLLWTRITSGAQDGAGSYQLQVTGVNSAGQGVATSPITVPEAFRARKLQKSAVTKVVTGNYANGDIKLFWIDATNSSAPVLVRFDEGEDLQAAIGSQDIFARFQMPYGCTQGYFAYHYTSTQTTGLTMLFDDIAITKQLVPMGAVVTDWVSYTPTGSLTTNTTYAGKWRRVGSNLEIDVIASVSGTTNAPSIVTFTIPPGLSIDATKLAAGAAVGDKVIVGSASFLDAGISSYPATCDISDSTSIRVLPWNAAASYVVNTAASNVPFAFGAGDSVCARVSVPILGWSSNQVLSSDADVRNVSAKVNLTSSQSIPSGPMTLLTFNSVENDTHNAYASGVFKCPVAGYYRVTATIFSGAGMNGTTALQLYKNGALYLQMDQNSGTSVVIFGRGAIDSVYCNAGDTLSLYTSQNSGASVITTADARYATASFTRISGSLQIAATEKIRVCAGSSAAQAVTTSFTTFVAGTVTESTHGLGTYDPTTGVFTANRNGTLKVRTGLLTNSTSITAGGAFQSRLFKGATGLKRVSGQRVTSSSGYVYNDGEATWPCIAGDQFTLKLQSDTATTLYPDATENWVEWEIT